MSTMNKAKTIGLLVAWVFSSSFLGLAVAQNDPNPPATNPDRQMSKQKGDADLLQKLHETNHEEIQMGQLAESNSYTQVVRDYSKHLVADHESFDRKVTSLAQQGGVILLRP